MLFFLKTFYYTFPILTLNAYNSYKDLIFKLNRRLVNKQHSNFFVIKTTRNKTNKTNKTS